MEESRPWIQWEQRYLGMFESANWPTGSSALWDVSMVVHTTGVTEITEVECEEKNKPENTMCVHMHVHECGGRLLKK